MRRISITLVIIALYSCNHSSEKNKPGTDTLQVADTATTAISPIHATRVGPESLPARLKIKGTVKEVWKWNDNLGENYFVTSYNKPHGKGC